MKAPPQVALALLIVFLPAWCTRGTAAEMTVHLQDAASTGTVVFVFFNDANAFGDLRDPVRVVTAPLDGREAYSISGLAPGEYALLVYQDENGNGQIDRNFIGIPSEPLGFSNRYEAKGPPSYHRAAFLLAEGEVPEFDVKLYRPLGRLGQWGVGIGIVARSSPYRDYRGGVYQVIPAATYIGERLQVYGPFLQYGLVGRGRFRLAATGKYRMGVYDEDESPFLAGMGDRKDTFMAGLAVQAQLPWGIRLSASYEHDVIGRIGGGAAHLGLGKSFQAGVFRFAPRVAANWLSSGLSDHDFGVPEATATFERPAYAPGAVFTVEGGAGVFVEITEDWLLIGIGGVELLGDDLTGSPIVSEEYVFKGFGVANYVF